MLASKSVFHLKRTTTNIAKKSRLLYAMPIRRLESYNRPKEYELRVGYGRPFKSFWFF